MDRINDEALQRLEELYRKSTTGTWRADRDRVYVQSALPESTYEYGVFDSVGTVRQKSNRQEDCEFVALAHELIPALIEEVRSLRNHLHPLPDAPEPLAGPAVQESDPVPLLWLLRPFHKVRVCGLPREPSRPIPASPVTTTSKWSTRQKKNDPKGTE
jgi:hypothetical protein